MTEQELLKKKVIDILSKTVKFAVVPKQQVYEKIMEILPCEIEVVNNNDECPETVKLYFGRESVEVKFFWQARTNTNGSPENCAYLKYIM